MAKFWVIIGSFLVMCGVLLYLWQELSRRAHWSWSQVFTTETAVFGCFFAGILLLLVALFEVVYRRRKDE
jgi:hypothetical protein